MNEEEIKNALSQAEQILVLYSGDARLTYEVDPNGKRFDLSPKALRVSVPLAYYQNEDWQDGMLFDLLWLLSLYPDEKKNPEAYLKRMEGYSPAIFEVVSLLRKKVERAGAGSDKAYSVPVLQSYAKHEIQRFLNALDSYYSLLHVFITSPSFQKEEARECIYERMNRQGTLVSRIDDSHGYRLFPYAFFLDGLPIEVEFPLRIRRAVHAETLGTKLSLLTKKEFEKEILHGEGIKERDEFIQAFLLPTYLRLWEADIQKMVIARSNGRQQEKGEKPFSEETKNPFPQEAEKERAIRELDEEKKKRKSQMSESLEQRQDLSAFGIQADDVALFHHYEKAVEPEREKLREYWKKIIGDASKEVNALRHERETGKLNVDTLVKKYPSFEEAKRKQNYRHLALFDQYELQKEMKKLPSHLDISFVIDNSGSMRSGKIESARLALSMVLLSLNDFKQELERNAALTHQKSEVRVETWFFGSQAHRVLNFEDEKKLREANQMKSITRLLGSDGSTNDAECLREVAASLSPREKEEMKDGKRVHLLFEITDGASSFAGAAKKEVEELTKAGVAIQAIEIGPKDPTAQETFAYVFGDKGTILEENVELLPETLVNQVKRGISKVFLR